MNKVVQGVQAFISKYGMPDIIGQNENTISTGGEIKEVVEVANNVSQQPVAKSKDKELNIPRSNQRGKAIGGNWSEHI